MLLDALLFTAGHVFEGDLTPADFDQKVLHSGYNATIVKFHAPWCAHCRELEPHWEELIASPWGERNRRILLASVDCGDEQNGGRHLCKKNGVRHLPTLKFWTPPDDEGSEWWGDRTATEMKAFARNLTATCDPARLDTCTQPQRDGLQPLFDMDVDKLLEEVTRYEAQMDQNVKAQLAHTARMQALSEDPEHRAKSKEEQQRAFSPFEKEAELATQRLRAGQKEFGYAYRAAKSVLLVRAPEALAAATRAVEKGEPQPRKQKAGKKKRKKKARAEKDEV